MEWFADRVYAYGVTLSAESIECIDCGYRQEHPSRGPLPPCPRYRDPTHTRAGWRIVRRGQTASGDAET
jgi:hypothetical protein